MALKPVKIKGLALIGKKKKEKRKIVFHFIGKKKGNSITNSIWLYFSLKEIALKNKKIIWHAKESNKGEKIVNRIVILVELVIVTD